MGEGSTTNYKWKEAEIFWRWVLAEIELKLYCVLDSSETVKRRKEGSMLNFVSSKAKFLKRSSPVVRSCEPLQEVGQNSVRQQLVHSRGRSLCHKRFINKFSWLEQRFQSPCAQHVTSPIQLLFITIWSTRNGFKFCVLLQPTESSRKLRKN